MKKFKVIETFSGIGAQHQALENLRKKGKLDYEVIGTSDWDVFAVQSYASIHYPGYEKAEDPKEKDLFDFKKKMFKSYSFSLDGKVPFENFHRIKDETYINWYKAFKAAKNIGTVVDSFKRVEEIGGDIDLLTYSFPCQDLSSAGNFHGFNEGIKEHTRSGLLYEIEKLVKQLYKKGKQPKFLLLENVINLVQKQHKADFNIWLNVLEKMGYKTIWGKVNANDYGQLQARRRVFALSIHDPKNKLDWEKNNRSDLVEILDEIYNKEFKPSWIQTHDKVFDFDNKYERESWLCQMKDTPSRVKMRNLGLTINKEYKGKISTVTTKQDRWPNVGNLKGVKRTEDTQGNKCKYLDERFITPREAYRLMGFPNSAYEKAHEKMNEVCVSEVAAREKLYKQAGNSIAVNALEMIFYYMTKLDEEIK